MHPTAFISTEHEQRMKAFVAGYYSLEMQLFETERIGLCTQSHGERYTVGASKMCLIEDNLVDYADEYFPRFFAHVAWADNEDTREQCLAHNKAHEKALLQDMQRLYSIVKRETLSLLSDIQTFLFPFVVPNLRFCERFHAAQREMKLLEWYCEKMLQYEGLVMEYGHTP